MSLTHDAPPVDAAGPPLLAARGLSKRYGGTAALSDVSLTLTRGESHALVGENGAGKSTLIRILSGSTRPEAGTLIFDGAEVRPTHPAAARRLGISVIHQELSIIPHLTVAENVFLGAMPTSRLGLVDRQQLNDRAREVLHRIGLDIAPDTSAAKLSIAQQQMVEIAKSVASGCRLLIMDEPTSSLGAQEAERLWALTAALKRQGTTILFVSHKLDEVLDNADRVTVLRDGRLVDTLPASGLAADRLIALMVGRNIDQNERTPEPTKGRALLEVDGLVRGGAFQDIAFSVSEGEIVAIAGLVGAGRTEVVRALFGADEPDAGSVRVNGHVLRSGDPRAAIAAGLGFLPENRKEQGLFLDLAIHENMSVPAARTTRLGVLRLRDEREAARASVARLAIAARSIDQSVRTLSGGNQQKVILARWLAVAPQVLIVDEPTRGIDLGAKHEIHRMLRQYAASGRAVLMVSSDLPEVLALATRVLVMRAGRLVGNLDRAQAGEESIGRLAMGM